MDLSVLSINSGTDFQKWHLGFEPNRLYPINIPNTWFDNSINIQKDAFEKLGGVSKEIQLAEESVEKLSFERVGEFAYTLVRLIPRYFQEYSYAPHHFCCQYFIQNNKSIKFSTHVSHWLNKNKNKIPNDISQKVMIILSKLGAIWDFENNQNKYKLLLTSHPGIFAQLGHFGVDRGSCFSHGGINRVQKFVLAQSKNTFIGIAYKNNVVACRFWGWFNDGLTYITNAYSYNGNIINKAREECGQFFSGTSNKTQGEFIVEGVWQNRDHVIYGEKQTTGILKTNFSGLESLRRCLHCGVEGYATEYVDHQYYCKNCIQIYTKVCSICSRVVFNHSRFVTQNIEGHICNNCRENKRDNYVHDYYTGVIMPRSEAITMRRSCYIHPSTIIKHKFTKCKCGWYCSASDSHWTYCK